MNWSDVRYFRAEEWGQDPDKVQPALVHALDQVRNLVGVPIVIHEAWARSGHAPKSLHKTTPARAVDFHFLGDLPPVAQFAALSSFALFGGIGWYPHWKNPGWHVDTRSASPRTLWFQEDNGLYRYGVFALAKELEKGVWHGKVA